MSEGDSLDESDFEHEYDSDGDDYSLSSVRVDKGKEKNDPLSFQSLSPAELEGETSKEINDVVAILGLQPSIASILLRHFRWNKDRLLDAYTEFPEEILEASGEPRSHIEPPIKRQRVSPEKFVCDICCDTPPEPDVYKERCGHQFCRNCWCTYIVGKVKDEGQSQVSCMEQGCPTVLESNTIKLLVDPQCYERYRSLLIESFVKVHPHLRFCPFPGCEQILSCHGVTKSTMLTHIPTVTCASSHTFCFGCGMEFDHRPAICAIANLWIKNTKEDTGTSQWMKVHTKNCPNCKNPTEKNGGCNRILCRQCQFQWCWMCGQNWNVHGYDRICNAFKEETVAESLDVQKQAQSNLEKWLFYFDRYHNHEFSAQQESSFYQRADEGMVEVQESSKLSWIEARFLRDAVDELTKCRTTLKWTYVMAFYIQKGNMKQIFEHIQADLEKAVEALSQMLDEPVDSSTVLGLRQRILDKTVYVQKRHRILLDDISVGLQEGRWQWTVPVE